MKPLLVLNGPNLNMLGRREPSIYGSQSLADIEILIQAHAAELGLSVECYQSNCEGALIEKLHSALDQNSAVIFNPGGYTHTSVALRDAISSIMPVPVIEVHLSNVYSRPEEFRHKSLLAPVCVGQISGFGSHGYLLAVNVAANILAKPNSG